MPPISRTDFPYPLRTIDGEVGVIVDSLKTNTLDVSGQTNLQNLFVADDIDCNTIRVRNAANFDTTISVLGTSTLNAVTAGNIAAASLSLVTPLAPVSGGTGQTSLASVSVGSSTNLNGGVAGAVPYQTGTSTTGFSAVGTSGAVLTSQGASSPVWQQAVNVSGNVISGAFLTTSGTAQATSTSNGTLSAPNGGISCGKQVFAGGRILCTDTSDATNTFDGSIATSGGISCSLSQSVGGAVIAAGPLITNNTLQATTISDGCIRAAGGISVAKQIVSGGKIICQDTSDASNTTDGSIQTLGGISSTKNIFSGNEIRASQILTSGGSYKIERGGTDRTVMSGDNVGGNRLKINPNSDYDRVDITNLNLVTGLSSVNNSFFSYSQGSWTPEFTSILVSDEPAFATDINITYTKQIGRYVMLGNMVMLYCEIEWRSVNAIQLIGVAIKNTTPFLYEGCVPGPYGLDKKVEPVTPLGLDDGPSFSHYKKATNRFEQLNWAYGTKLSPYIYKSGVGPEPPFDATPYNLNWTSVTLKI